MCINHVITTNRNNKLYSLTFSLVADLSYCVCNFILSNSTGQFTKEITAPVNAPAFATSSNFKIN